MCLLLSKRRRVPFAAVWSQPGVVCSEKVTFDPLTCWPFQKRTPQGQFRGPPTCTHQVWRRSVKGPQRSRGTNKQTNRQTDKRCLNYSMILKEYEACFRRSNESAVHVLPWMILPVPNSLLDYMHDCMLCVIHCVYSHCISMLIYFYSMQTNSIFTTDIYFHNPTIQF